MTTAINQGRVPPIELRHRLHIAREFAGYDREELAELIAVSRNTIANAETGRAQPRRIMINAWAMACGVPVSWLLTGEHPSGDPGPIDGLGIISTDHRVQASKDASVTPISRTPKVLDRVSNTRGGRCA